MRQSHQCFHYFHFSDSAQSLQCSPSNLLEEKKSEHELWMILCSNLSLIKRDWQKSNENLLKKEWFSILNQVLEHWWSVMGNKKKNNVEKDCYSTSSQLYWAMTIFHHKELNSLAMKHNNTLHIKTKGTYEPIPSFSGRSWNVPLLNYNVDE